MGAGSLASAFRAVGLATLAISIPAGAAFAQAGIYTCVDAKGRRLTSDRPIPECIDREQKELNATGTVKRIVPRSMTADEAAAEDDKNRRAAEERQRLADEKKKERALLARYPDRATHDRERVQAMAAIEEVIATANRRAVDLADERKKIQGDMESYKSDRSKMPASLKRRFDENEQSIAAQRRFLENQADEKRRVNARFDEELVKLQQLWAQVRGAAATAARPASAKP